MEPYIYSIVTAVFTGGVAYGGFRVSMNGTKKRLERLERFEHDHSERLVRVETKIDTLLERI